MRITSLQIRNFLSYGEKKQNINFKEGINFIVGPNGSGKTNVVRAIKLIASCLEEYEKDLEKLDPDINLKMHIKLSKQERKLLGSILCVSILREIDEIEQSGQFNNFREEFYKDILEETSDAKIKTIYEANTKLLNLKTIKTEFSQEVKTREQRNQLISNLQIQNYQSFKKYLEKPELEINLGLMKGNLLQEFKQLLLTDKAHITIGEIFKALVINLGADATKLNVSIFIKWDQKRLELDFDGLKTKNSQDKAIKIFRSIHNFLLARKKPISIKTIEEMIDYNFNLEEPCRIIFPRLDVKFSYDEIKNLTYAITDQLKKYYSNDFQETHLIFVDIIKKIFKYDTVVIPEHRGLISEDNRGISYFTLTNLPEILYKWKNSSNQKERERFYILKEEFKIIFKMDFDVYIKDNSIQIKNEYPILKIGDVIRASSYRTARGDDTQKVVKWDDLVEDVIERIPLIQFIDSRNISIEIHEAPSGAYETLMILTALFERGDKTIIIDEPARALHPQLQKKVIKSISNYLKEEIIPTFILITHSPYFINDFITSQIWKCVYGKLIKFNISEIDKEDKTKKKKLTEKSAVNFLNKTDSVNKLLFSNRILIVEGSNDKLFIEELDTVFPDKINLESNGWDITELHGAGNFPIVWKLVKLLDVEFCFILDLDTAFPIPNKSKPNIEKEYPPFKKSIIGKMLKEFKTQGELNKFLDLTYEEVTKDIKLLNEFTKLMLEDNIFIWKLGALEEVLETLAGEKIRLRKANSETIYEMMQKIGKDFTKYETLQDLAKLLNIT